jgi:hypothetical protein
MNFSQQGNIDPIITAKKQLKQNVNFQLCMEIMLLDLYAGGNI